jgi:drug/metabolite transporter (DMT)-like permease
MRNSTDDIVFCSSQVAPLVIWRNVLMCLAYATWWAFDERFFRGGSEHMGFSRGRFSHGHGNVPIAREPFPWRLNPVTWWRVVFLAIGPGFACSWLQTLAQAQVDAAEAQVLMSTTPLWGAAWAFGMMGERMTALGWVGGGTIVAGAVLVADRTAAKKRPNLTLPPRGNKSS